MLDALHHRPYKRAVTLNLSTERGQEMMRRLAAASDVLIEGFRPGTLERWNLAPETLHEINPRLVIARVTGFGQFGPYSQRPGFGTLAEAMSGFAAIWVSAVGRHGGASPTLRSKTSRVRP